MNVTYLLSFQKLVLFMSSLFYLYIYTTLILKKKSYVHNNPIYVQPYCFLIFYNVVNNSKQSYFSKADSVHCKWKRSLCTVCVFNRQGVKPLTQHHVFAVLSHIDCWCSNYPVTHSSVCACVSDFHVCVGGMASPYGPSAAALCTSWGAGGAPGGQAVCSWRTEICAGLMGARAPWAPSSPSLTTPPTPAGLTSLLCCRPLSDASIKQESAAGICTHLNRQNGLEEVWLRYMPFHPRSVLHNAW